jgi:hypothetical protein
MEVISMNSSDLIQIGIISSFFIAFLGYGFHLLTYAFGDRSIIDERLRRYGRVAER